MGLIVPVDYYVACCTGPPQGPPPASGLFPAHRRARVITVNSFCKNTLLNKNNIYNGLREAVGPLGWRIGACGGDTQTLI